VVVAPADLEESAVSVVLVLVSSVVTAVVAKLEGATTPPRPHKQCGWCLSAGRTRGAGAES
jgi:hypothetical protein